MKLSEAIRLGAMATAPIHGPMFGLHGGTICATCAIGAPIFALYGEDAYAKSQHDATVVSELIYDHWPYMRLVEHPERRTRWTGAAAIINLFESCCWTREQIAAWVETIEATVLEDRSTPVESAVAPAFVLAASGAMRGV